MSVRPQRRERDEREELARQDEPEALSGEEQSSPHPGGPPPKRTVLSATEARQGEIILGKAGIWIWVGAFAAIVLLVLVFSFWP